MPTGQGIDRITGKLISGWRHVEQSIWVLLTTSKKSRVMRRQVGAGVPRFVDSPMNPVNIIDLYASVAKAIADYEPRFRVSRMSIESVSQGGQISVAIQGVYFPRGHLGDFTVSEPKTVSVPL